MAETSLTIACVRIVIDSGLARRRRYDRAAGLTRLVTEKASQADAAQRAGRAARQALGVAYRLWEAAATSGMPPYDPPAILPRALYTLLADCAQWGVDGPAPLRWEARRVGKECARTYRSRLAASLKKQKTTTSNR